MSWRLRQLRSRRRTRQIPAMQPRERRAGRSGFRRLHVRRSYRTVCAARQSQRDGIPRDLLPRMMPQRIGLCLASGRCSQPEHFPAAPPPTPQAQQATATEAAILRLWKPAGFHHEARHGELFGMGCTCSQAFLLSAKRVSSFGPARSPHEMASAGWGTPAHADTRSARLRHCRAFLPLGPARTSLRRPRLRGR